MTPVLARLKPAEMLLSGYKDNIKYGMMILFVIDVTKHENIQI